MQKFQIFKKKECIQYLSILLIVMSLFFILKLFFFSFELRSCGTLISTPCFRYDWINSSTISVLLLLLLIIPFFIKKKSSRVVVLGIIFILSLLGKEIFFFFSPDFEFYFTDRAKKEIYKDDVFHVETYIDYQERYCQIEMGWLYLRHGRGSWCSWSGNIDLDPRVKVKDFITLLEYSKKKNDKYEYRGYAGASKIVGFENMIQEYDDKTYQLYIINSSGGDDRENLDILKQNTLYQDVKDLISFYQKNLDEGLELKSKLKYDKLRVFWEINDKEMKERIQKMDGINLEVLY